MALGDRFQYFSGNPAPVNGQIRAARCLLEGMDFNGSAGGFYMLLFDKLAAPIAGDVPVMTFAILSNAWMTWRAPPSPLTFQNGLWFASSTTLTVLTVSVATVSMQAYGRDA